MEPTITCLDARIEQEVRTPSDVETGDVIAFRTAACWPGRDATGFINHRVIETREGPDGPEYLTQGDANPKPDCWIPFDAIVGKVVDVQRNVYPENAALREAVNIVTGAALAAQRDYLDHIEVICGHRDPDACTATGADYDKGVRLWERTERTKADLDCWLTKARNSEYPGHIPADCKEETQFPGIPQ